MKNRDFEILNRSLLAVLLLVAGSAMAGLEGEAAYKMTEQQLLEVVRKGAVSDQVTACQELMHRGTAASVPVLAARLTDAAQPALFHAALYGLQNIPGKEADAALAAAESKVTGTRRTAVAHVRAFRANPVPDGYAGATAAVTAFPPKTAVQRGETAQIEPLLAAALGVGEAASVAHRQLAAFPNAQLDGRLLNLVTQGPDAKKARLAATLLGERRARAVLPQLIAFAKTTQDTRRREDIFKCLAYLCSAKQDLPVLLDLLNRFPEEDRLEGSIIRLLAQEFLPESQSVKVVSARFGNFENGRVADVKPMVDALVEAGSREIMAGCRLVGRGGFPSDPAPGQPKQLRISYTVGGGPVRQAVVADGEILAFGDTVLPGPLAKTLVEAWAKAQGATRVTLRRIIAALERRGRVPGSDAVLFRPLGNTKDLSDWKQDGTFFSMRDGVLTAESTPQNPCKKSRYLIYAKEQFTDFELRGEFRLSAGANSGVQLRSTDELLVDSGYQADMDGGGNIVGYIFHTRQYLVGERGADVALASNGAKNVAPFADGKELQKLYRVNDWNDLRVIVKDRMIAVWINGVRTAAVIDAREDFLPKKGYISLQMHQGKPMKIEFRGLRVRTDEVALDSNLEKALSDQLERLEKGEAPKFDGATWIWHAKALKPETAVSFRAELDLPAGELEKAALIFTCDDSAVVSVNGREVGSQTGSKLWYTPTPVCGLERTNLKPGRNVIEVAAVNHAGTGAGFLAMVEATYKDGRIVRFPSNIRGWKVSNDGGKTFDVPVAVCPYGGQPYGYFK